MLHWQITYINGNIDKLVRNTNCNVSLITYLKGRDVISDREVDLLCDESKPPQDRALKLYKTLQTRTGGHKVLKDALSHTRQTGALRLLNTGSERNDRCVKYKKLEYDKNVIIQKICNNIVVYAGEFGTRPAAVKVFLGPGSNNNMRTAENELDVLTSLDWHEIIVRCFIGKTLATGIRSRFVIALDYRKTLQKVSMDTELGGMAVGMINQILSGVSFLHRHRVIHLNLKPEKIFVDQRDSSYVQLKIGEFGVSRRLPAGENSINVYMGTVFEKGAASFETPEVLIFGDGLQSQDDMVHIDVPLFFQTDVYCIGLLCYFILSGGKHAFGGLLQRKNNIRNNSHQMEVKYFSKVSLESKSCILSMLSHSPTDRPPVDEINIL